MTYRLGIDIGGTFTDFALIHDNTDKVVTYKELTTPEDPSIGVLRGCEALLAREECSMRQVRVIDHATTLVTNAIIEGKGARAGMLVTEGFEDVLDIGEERRYDLFDLALKYPESLVPRYMRRPVKERMRYSGQCVTPIDLEAVHRSVKGLVDSQAIESLAVCFLHSYANPEHEKLAVDTIRKSFPGLYVSASADVLPFIREFYRWTTTAINALVQPLMDRYLQRLEQGFAQLGFSGSFHMMTSSGGTVTLDTARRYPVRLLESGPAAGALMSGYHGRASSLSNLLSFDMGGTTAKGAIVQNGEPKKKYDIEVARCHENKPGSGYQVRIPTVDLVEIGAGGGSIAELDSRGLIRVGPRSAGASPGPACYGRGGTEATVTDANLVLGYLNPDYFLGGRMKLDIAAAERAVETKIGKALRLDLIRAAWGVHEVINEDIARAFRVYASERGFDYRQSLMVAFGGSGPMHATRIARKLGIPKVIVPAGAGVMSAMGLLVSPMAFETVRSRRINARLLDEKAIDAEFAPLVELASAPLLSAGVPFDAIDVRRKIDMRYVGQGHEIEVPIHGRANSSEVERLFGESYRRLFSSVMLSDPVETVNWKVEARYSRNKADGRINVFYEIEEKANRKRSRKVFFEERGGFVDCPVYSTDQLAPDVSVAGPVLIEERESTYVIGPNDVATLDDFGLITIELKRTAPQ